MDILNNLKVDGTITATGDITDGSSNKLSKKLDKLTTGPTAGTYTSVTINGEGQVTGGSNPTTLAGYGITDAVDIANAQTITGIKTFTEARTTTRTYNSANVNDIVTIGSLVSNPSVVHTTGNESISGIKTFTTYPSIPAGPLDVKHSKATYPPATDTDYPVLTIEDKNGVIIGRLYYRSLASGVTALYAGVKNADNTWNYVQIASGR